ncbi:Chromatin modification-related protein EAF3 [Wallemia ichthyophaga EXF-994]|uniref:Chromatin modification-related protein EAF3 n=1 Tax=Wallemia ichthyophaga (strain EXF-994 / CBS 113033) TaxID=1299270 RepID=R9ABR0_WALI9|nr:Chromatin modification-related protein EAF3 [Wallemia ichthyophaga EXF-994]EOQ99567.1 Chromatin modification-related protein EAF3 [Wallemia ichthyophaga EXF-994]
MRLSGFKDLLFTGEQIPSYFVHYKGWKQSWDEWVPESRMHKLTPDNRQKQKSLKEAILKKKQPQSNTHSHSIPSNKSKGRQSQHTDNPRKRGRDTEDSSLESQKRPEIKLVIPDELKVTLVDDWEFITKNNQLIPLPRTPSIQSILSSYKSHASKNIKVAAGHHKSKKIALIEEVLNGLEVYFNRAIASNLLYRFERPQFVKVKKEADERPQNHQLKHMTSIYGVEHLLRLIVNLPSMLAYTSIDAESATILHETVQNLLDWIIDNKKQLFLPEYENSSPNYQNRVNAGS